MSSPFASESQSEPIPLPWDASQFAVVRSLTGGEVEAAERELMRNFVNGRSTRGFSQALSRILAGDGTAADLKLALADPLSRFDRLTVVRAGLVSWTYKKPTTPHVDPADAKKLVDPIGDLKDEALEFFATEIIRRTKPGLFETDEQLEDAKVKG